MLQQNGRFRLSNVQQLWTGGLQQEQEIPDGFQVKSRENLFTGFGML